MIESKGYKITPIDGDLAVSRNAEIGRDVDIHGKARVAGSMKVEGFLDAPHIKGAAKGLFNSVEELTREYPNPRPGWFAIVLDATNKEMGILYKAENRGWVATTDEARPYEFIMDSINVFASKGELEDERSRATEAEEQLRRGIEQEATRATEAENNIKSKALQTDTVHFSQDTRGVSFGGRSIDGKSVVDELIPVATTEMPGAMSPEDKVQILNNKKDIENTNIGIEELKAVLVDGSFVVGVANLANAVKAGAVTFEMLDGKLRLSVSVVDDLETANTLMPLSANQGKILKELIDIINGTGEGSTDKKITDAIAALVDSAPENLDTLRELAEWIENHGAEVAEMLAAIEGLYNELGREIDARMSVDNDTRGKGVLFGGFSNRQTTADEVVIRYKNIAQNAEGAFAIPAATTEKAGVMSAEDKVLLEANATNLTETKKNIANQLLATPAADEVTITGRNEQSMRINFEGNIPAATTEKAGVMSAEQVKTLQAHSEGLAILNTTILNYNRKIGNFTPVDKATVVANLGTAVERGMIVTFYSANGWKSIRYISSKATAEAFANVDNWEDVDKDISSEIDKIKDGDTIVGQAREIHSRNGKNVTDSFLVRTTAGSGTIGDGVASLKSVGGNIVKNIIDLSIVTATNSTKIDSGNISIFQRRGNDRFGFKIQTNRVVGHIYYFSCYMKTEIADNVILYLDSNAKYLSRSNNIWIHNSCIVSATNTTSLTTFNIGDPGSYKNSYAALSSLLLIDLTEMFGAGNEPDKDTCDRLFGTMDALPQGLSIANPKEFKSTGFNQFNPKNVLEGKAVVDNAIVSGDKKIAVVPCLPCKIGVGENNGYCIHGEFGEDINVYLTPLNPMEVNGELYMHELTKDATTDTYVPLIKGYMLVEVFTTANLCAHFLWSEDKCERDSYEPYYKSVVELPVIPQMSEWGLAGIQSSGTLVANTIDFERGVYVKRIGSVKVGDLNWKYTAEYNTFTVLPQGAPQTYSPVAAMVDKYTYIGTIASFNITDNKVCWWRSGNYGIAIKDDSYSDVTSFKSANADLILYYELAEPEEYPLLKVDNNYISSDYGVEQFDSVVPCNANNLYYMRSLAGETRNFLDRMYNNTAKTDAKEVADYITKNLADKIPQATLENDGLMSAADKKGIDNLKTISVTDGDCCDFSIVDEKNNAILILSDGHIKTKNFDSRNGVNNTKFIDRDIYALGDSTTQGAGSGETSVLGSKSWFDRLVTKIQFRSYRKLAANGATTMKQEGLGALSSQINYLPLVGNPIILIMIGTNDINRAHIRGDVNAVLGMQYEELDEMASFAEAYRYNLETIKRRLPNAEIIAMMPLTPQLNDESGAESYRDIERVICKALSIPVLEVRNECGINRFCNYGFAQVKEAEIENATVFMADALHPNNAGYERIANYIASKLNKYIQ